MASRRGERAAACVYVRVSALRLHREARSCGISTAVCGSRGKGSEVGARRRLVKQSKGNSRYFFRGLSKSRSRVRTAARLFRASPKMQVNKLGRIGGCFFGGVGGRSMASEQSGSPPSCSASSLALTPRHTHNTRHTHTHTHTHTHLETRARALCSPPPSPPPTRAPRRPLAKAAAAAAKAAAAPSPPPVETHRTHSRRDKARARARADVPTPSGRARRAAASPRSERGDTRRTRGEGKTRGRGHSSTHPRACGARASAARRTTP
jgi:hypothetical protein